MQRRVLFVAYYFPPLSGAGVFRSLKFSKYLPEFGWTPYVLTTADDFRSVNDFSLLREIPGTVPVERVSAYWDFHKLASCLRPLERLRGGWRLSFLVHRLLDYLKIPDDRVGWMIPGYLRARALIRAHRIDAVYTTSAPYCSHLIGYWVKRTTGLPWVADFRDEWAKNPLYKFQPTRLHRWLSQELERLVVKQADSVISVCEPIVDMLRHGASDTTKFATITNGFDAQDIYSARSRAARRPAGVFRLVYTGSFYGRPTYFIEALEGLLQQGEISPDEIRVRLIGGVGSPTLGRREWQQILECPGHLTHSEALVEQQQSDCLLLFIPKARGDYAYSGKVFEYIASGKPILALVPPDGLAAKLIRESRTGFVVAPDDVPSIQATLLSLFKEWKAGRLAIQPDEEVIERYDRRHLTGQLAAILDRLQMNLSSCHREAGARGTDDR